MANLYQHPEMHRYVIEKLAEKPGSFLRSFLECCQSADMENFKMVKWVLKELMMKYPLRDPSKVKVGKKAGLAFEGEI